jgi:hypothetical protein
MLTLTSPPNTGELSPSRFVLLLPLRKELSPAVGYASETSERDAKDNVPSAMLAGNVTSFPYRNARILEPLSEIELRSPSLPFGYNLLCAHVRGGRKIMSRWMLPIQIGFR